MSDGERLEGRILQRRFLVGPALGEGGMGTVYRATDLRTGGTVAVKVVRDELAADRTYLARLRREAQLAASVDSPRVVRIVDIDSEGEVTYLVMEYVDGVTLAELLRAGPMPPRKALHVAREVAWALDAINARGVIHRDLKPQNIKVDPGGAVKLLDFGIARAEGVPGVTSVGLFVGSVIYAAPERVDGHADIRSDIYAVGIILYELLTGQPPFQGATPVAVLDRHVREAAPPLPDSVPAKTRDVMMRCLEKRPEDRYQTPRELVQALSAAIADAGGTADLRAAPPPAPAPPPFSSPDETLPVALQAGVETGAAALPARAGVRRQMVLILIAACIVVLLVIVAGVAAARAAPSPGAVWSMLAPVPGQTSPPAPSLKGGGASVENSTGTQGTWPAQHEGHATRMSGQVMLPLP